MIMATTHQHPTSSDPMLKERYYEPAPQDIDIENFRKVIESRRSVRKFTDKTIPAEVLSSSAEPKE